jgi:FtsZ-binding cell division protein ZapB
MGYGGAPGWVYRREAASRESSLRNEVTEYLHKISALENENETFKKENELLSWRIKYLEDFLGK